MVFTIHLPNFSRDFHINGNCVKFFAKFLLLTRRGRDLNTILFFLLSHKDDLERKWWWQWNKNEILQLCCNQFNFNRSIYWTSNSPYKPLPKKNNSPYNQPTISHKSGCHWLSAFKMFSSWNFTSRVYIGHHYFLDCLHRIVNNVSYPLHAHHKKNIICRQNDFTTRVSLTILSKRIEFIDT